MENTPPASLPPTPPPAQQGMSTRNKTIIIVVAVLAGLCLIACVVGLLALRTVGRSVTQSVQEDPAAVESQAGEIAEIEIPAGFTPQGSVNILGMEMAIYEDTSANAALVLLQMPMQMEITEQTIEQMRTNIGTQTGRTMENVQVVDDYETTIRGKPGRVIIHEGTDEGETFRQMFVVFEGKGGTAMLSIFGPAATWDQPAYDAMLEGIR